MPPPSSDDIADAPPGDARRACGGASRRVRRRTGEPPVFASAARRPPMDAIRALVVGCVTTAAREIVHILVPDPAHAERVLGTHLAAVVQTAMGSAVAPDVVFGDDRAQSQNARQAAVENIKQMKRMLATTIVPPGAKPSRSATRKRGHDAEDDARGEEARVVADGSDRAEGGRAGMLAGSTAPTDDTRAQPPGRSLVQIVEDRLRRGLSSRIVAVAGGGG